MVDDDTVLDQRLAKARAIDEPGFGEFFLLRFIVVGTDLSTMAMSCNATAIWRAHRKGAFFANPCHTQIHPTAIPSSDEFQSKLTLMSESLRNDGRISLIGIHPAPWLHVSASRGASRAPP